MWPQIDHILPPCVTQVNSSTSPNIFSTLSKVLRSKAPTGDYTSITISVLFLFAAMRFA